MTQYSLPNNYGVKLAISIAIAIALALFFVFSPYEEAPFPEEAFERLQLLVGLVVVGYAAILALVIRPLVSPLGQMPLFIISGVVIVWAIIHLASRDDASFTSWFFEPSNENSLGAMLSSTILLMIGISAILIGFLANITQPWVRGYWVFIGFGFLFLSMDEYFSLHESVSFWRTGYMAFGAFLALGSLTVYWLAYREMPQIFGLIVIGLGIMGFSGVAMDAFSNDHSLSLGPIEYNGFRCAHFELGVECHSYGIIEEFLEFVGMAFILAAMLSFASTHVKRVNQISGAIAGAAVLWFMFTIVYFWGVPVVQARIAAEDINVTYNDGLFTLRGYELSHTDTIQAGDVLSGSLYVDLGEDIDNNYAATVQLWAKPSQEKIAQRDNPLGIEYPTSAWIPNLTVKTDFEFEIPADLKTPATYWLIIKIWEGFPDDESTVALGVPLVIDDQTSLRMIDDLQDTFILADLVGVPESDPVAPTDEVDFFFSDGFRLYGYDMPTTAEIGGTLPIQFWWQNESPNRQLIQFIHIFHQDSDAFFTFDEQTFDGTYPPEDWISDTSMTDTRTITLPSDMLSGVYDVVMGMYEINSGERVIVTGTDGQPLANFVVPLGTLTVE